TISGSLRLFRKTEKRVVKLIVEIGNAVWRKPQELLVPRPAVIDDPRTSHFQIRVIGDQLLVRVVINAESDKDDRFHSRDPVERFSKFNQLSRSFPDGPASKPELRQRRYDEAQRNQTDEHPLRKHRGRTGTIREPADQPKDRAPEAECRDEGEDGLSLDVVDAP